MVCGDVAREEIAREGVGISISTRESALPTSQRLRRQYGRLEIAPKTSSHKWICQCLLEFHFIEQSVNNTSNVHDECCLQSCCLGTYENHEIVGGHVEYGAQS